MMRRSLTVGVGLLLVAAACSSSKGSGETGSGGTASGSGSSSGAGAGHGTSSSGGGSTSSASSSSGGGSTSSGSSSSGGAITGSRCTSSTWSGSDEFHAFSPTANSSVPQASGWGVYDNQWSCSGGTACLDETLYACTAGSWYVTANLPANNTAVLTYASTQVNFSQVPLSTFKGITSTFSEVSPHDASGTSGSFGDYEAAYDVFFGPNNDNEIMVWVDNNGQTPGGGWNAQKSGVTIGGTTFDVYFSGSTTYWVAKQNFTSGSVDLLSIFQYTTGTLHNFDAAQSTGSLSQIQFGWELCSTNGKQETFYLDEFSVVAN